MSDTQDDGFNEETFKGLEESATPATPADPATPATPPPAADPATPPVTPPAEPPKDDPKPAEEPKKDEQATPETPKTEGEPTSPASDEKKTEGEPKPGEAPTPTAPPEAPQPLTKDDVQAVVSNLLETERTSGKELETATKEVMEAYYPDGLDNTLKTPEGKELRSPQDVVEATNGQMSTEQAAQWLMNEQFKLDQQIKDINDNARKIAETTVNFKRDAVAAVQKYEPLFKAYPHLQQKVFDKLKEQLKVDEQKNVILSAPDVMGHYDFYLEPYQLAFEHANNQPATNPTPDPTPPPAKPGAEDRLDEGGDGGASPVDDPNDFAQQVKKQLANPL